MKNVYILCHNYPYLDYGIYIETDMNIDEVADIVVGLQFYIEDNTTHGEHTCITEEMASYLLCQYFECVEYIDEINLDESHCINLYAERERRRGNDYKKYIEKIKPYAETEYLTKLCSYFNDDTVFSGAYTILNPQEIIGKYN